jgi:uncharacterized protein YjiS (DUF1127 family)
MTTVIRLAPGLNWLARTYNTLKTKLAARKASALAIRTLDALTDRELADIGLHRSMIRSYVRGDMNV